MGQYANFYNSINKDRVYDASSFEEWLKPFFKTGVFNSQLQVVQNSGMNITVKPGNAFIEGKLKYFENDTVLSVDAAHATYNRIDNVIVRRNDTNRDFTIMIQKGTNANSPTAPSPVRQDGIYDIVIAQIYVQAASIEIFQRNITDTRANSSLCGWVVSNIEEVDFEQLAAQFNDYFDDFKTTNLNSFNTWFETIKGILGEDEAAELLQLIQANQASIESINGSLPSTTKTITIQPTEWVDKKYTLNDPLITATSNQEWCLPVYNDSSDDAMFDAIDAARIRSGGQSAGKAIIKCQGDVPTIAIKLDVIFRGVK